MKRNQEFRNVGRRQCRGGGQSEGVEEEEEEERGDDNLGNCERLGIGDRERYRQETEKGEKLRKEITKP